MKALAILLCALAVGGCGYLDKMLNSKEYAQFCSWAPVAIAGIQGATAEALTDPAKQEVGAALAKAAHYLQLAAGQCPTPGA